MKGAVEIERIVMFLCGTISPENEYLLDGVEVYRSVAMRQVPALVETLQKNGTIDAFIAPAGAAAEVEKYVAQPVIRSDPTYFDLLETMITAEQETGGSHQKMALLLHSSREPHIDVRLFQPMLKNDLHAFFYRNSDDIPPIVKDLALQNYSIVIGGESVSKAASSVGLRAFLVHLGVDSLSVAVSRARASAQLLQTAKKRGEELQTAFNLFDDGVLVLDTTGMITECNRSAKEFFRIHDHALIGQRINDLTGDDSWQRVYRDGEKNYETFWENGQEKYFCTCRPVIVDGTTQGAVVTMQGVRKIETLEHRYRSSRSDGLTARFHFGDIIGESSTIRETIELAKIYAGTNSPILIEGETGTGKEIFAQSIHNYSARFQDPFVAINCAALPESLLESELVGYEAGAFTGARRSGKPGLFEIAHQGTIFLDEISSMPLVLQTRLLRILQEQRVMRLGSDHVIPVDVRVIAASNGDLARMVEEGTFRRDLFYRLKVMSLTLPPLRERKEDIAALMHHYYLRYTQEYGETAPVPPDLQEQLRKYPWPGNIRELANFVEWYVVVSRARPVSTEHILNKHFGSPAFAQAQPPEDFFPQEQADDPDQQRVYQIRRGTISDMTMQLIHETLRRNGGNRLATARELGISRTTLLKKLESESENQSSADSLADQ